MQRSTSERGTCLRLGRRRRAARTAHWRNKRLLPHPNPPTHTHARRSIREIVEGPPAQLIEAVAERIAGRVLAEHPGVAAVTVGVAKPHVAVSGVVHSLGVEVTRRRQRVAEL